MRHLKPYKIFESEDFDIEEKINKIFNIDEDDYELVDEDGLRNTYEEDRLYDDQNQEITNKGATVIATQIGENEMSLRGLRSENKNKGEASELLDKIITIADKMGYVIKLGAFAEEGGLTQEELINFYKKKGFVFNGRNGERKPNIQYPQQISVLK
jgi:GNAT superfamily N-acetyltransferase